MTQLSHENTATEQQKAPPAKKKNKTWRWILCTISAVILLPVLLLLTALTTGSGQRLLIQTADKFMGNLHIEQISGGLQEGLQLKKISFQSQGIDTNIEQARLQLDLHCLLSAKICLKDLTLTQPTIQIDTTQLPKSEKKPSQPMKKINLPVAIEVNHIEVNQLALTIDQQQIQLDKFQTALTLNNVQGLTLLPTEINGLAITQQYTENKITEKNSVSTANKPFSWRKLTEQLKRPLLADLPEIELPFDLHIQDIQGKNWRYQQIGNPNLQHSDLRQIEITNISLQADSTDNQFHLQKFQLESNLGQLQGEGKIQLTQAFPLELQLQAKLKDLKHEGELLLPQSDIQLTLSGSLKKQTALSLQTQGILDATLQAKAELTTPQTPFNIELNVTKGQYPFEKGSADPLKIQDIHFTAQGDLLNYQAELQGNVSGMGMPKTQAELALEGELTQLSLQKLKLNALNMQANANANVDWKDKIKLKSHVDLKGNNVRFNNIRINKIDLLADINLEDVLQGQVDLAVNGFNFNEIKLNNTKLQIKGSEQQHKLTLISQGEPVSVNLDLNGKFDRTSQQWQGVLQQINIQQPLIGTLTNSESIQLSYDNKNMLAQVSAHCWKAPDIHLCFPQKFSAGKSGEIPFEFKSINLDLVNKLIKQETFKGQVSSQGKFAWFTDKAPYMTLQLKGNNLMVAQKLDYRTLKLTIPTLNLNTELQNNNLTLNANINIQNQGQINTELKLADLANQKKLNGNLKIRGINLNIANQLLSSGEKIDGNINANLSFNGDLNRPLLNGEFALEHIQAKMNSMPFDITNGTIGLNFYGNHSILKGDIQTNESSLNVEGQADWHNLDSWQAKLRINADKFKVNIPAIAKLQVSPNIEINAMPKLLDLSGNIDIPWARIEIESLPESAVALTPDEVILDGPNKTKERKLAKGEIAATTKSGMQIRSDLKIKIGDGVHLNAYGLKTNLYGLLLVQQEDGRLGLFGQINLKNGQYESFGQNLLIRTGMISFSGLPSQPMLNIEAIRNPTAMENTNIIAGVKVVGIADSPEVTVFSEPSTSQDQALSYLLTGRSLENSGQAGSGGSIGAALLGIGLAKSGKLVGGIGEAFGIQDLNLGTSGVGDGSKVVVSGNITPRLQVKYGVGLFDGLAELTLRYRLLPKLYLQSVSGVNQAVDLLYQFEF